MSKKNPKQRTKKPKEEVDRPEPKEEVDRPEWLPDGFTVDEDGIYREDEFVCGPFEAVAMLRDENSNKWSLLIEFMDPDSVMKSVPVDRSRLHGDLRALKAELAGHGLKITVGFDFDSLFNNIKVDGRLRCADKPGFVGDDVFVTPWGDSIVKDDRSEHGFLAPEKRLTNQTAGTAEGQIAAFQAAFDEAFSTGADHFAVAALAGSAGCVVDYLKLDSTPLLSLTGPSTGGKTTANRIAASAGGNPREDEGLLHTLQAASTGGIELLASRANGTFLGLDEPSTASKRLLGDLEKMVFMLASGGGSKRMNRSASTFRPVMKWRTFVMITSELKVSTILRRLGKTPKTGFNVRLIELDISQEPRVDEGPFDKIMACMQHYGHIIPLIAEHLLCRETREGLQNRLAEMTDKLAGDKASPTQHRSASILALLWVVGDLYKATGIARADHDFELVIRRLWARYLESPEARALDPVEAAADKLREELLSRRGFDVAPISAINDDRYRSREPVAWYCADDNDKHITFYVPVKNLEALSDGIVNARMLGSLLRKQGILQVLGNADTSKDNAHKAIPSVGDIRHYRLVYPAPAKSDLPATNLVDAAEFEKRRAVMSAAA